MAVPGNMLTLVPNGVAGNWGLQLQGSGAGDVYVQMGTANICGNTGDDKIRIKGTTGAATARATFEAKGVFGNPMIVAQGAVGTVGAGEVGISGATQTTVGAAGAASALPATPTGYIKIDVAGVNRVIPFYDIS